MAQSHRYALRKEYFGGLLIDYVASDYKILSHKEYTRLESLVLGDSIYTEEFAPLYDCGSGRFLISGNDESTHTKGICADDIRLISIPGDPPGNQLSAPIKVYDTYTRRCNLQCQHCYSSSGSASEWSERSISETQILMKKFCEIGVFEWQFTGGEPTITPELISAIEIAQALGLRVSLNTNGCWDQLITAQLLNSGIKEIIVSLEGSRVTNDRRRGKGTFSRIMSTLMAIADHNHNLPVNKIKVILNMAVGRDNVSEIYYVAHLAAALGVDVNFVPLKPSGRALKTLQKQILSTVEYRNFDLAIQKLRAMPTIRTSGIRLGLKHKDLYCTDYPNRSHLPFPFNYSECQALTTAIGLLPDGRVFACPFLMDQQEYIGPNVLQVDVLEAWRASRMQCFRMATKHDCLDCRYYMQSCRGKCRAAVILNGGTIKNGVLVGDDPFCFRAIIQD